MKTLVHIMTVLALLVCVGSAQAVLLVDQQQTTVNNDFDAGYGVATCQGFTPAVNRIDAVELYLLGWGSGGSAPVTTYVDIYNALGGSTCYPDIDAGSLGTASLGFQQGVTATGQWYQLDYSSPVALTPGTTYILVVSAPGGSSQSNPKFGAGFINPGDYYTGGGYVAWISGSDNASATWGEAMEAGVPPTYNKDVSFKTLYIPEPATLLVLLAGAGLALGRRR